MIKELNSTTDFGKLLQHDQLLKAIKEGNKFEFIWNTFDSKVSRLGFRELTESVIQMNSG